VILILGSHLCHLTARSCMFLKREYTLRMIYKRSSLNHEGNKAVSRTFKEVGNRTSRYTRMLTALFAGPGGTRHSRICGYRFPSSPEIELNRYSCIIPTIYDGVLHHKTHADTQNTERFAFVSCQSRVLSYS
jgi:hypothetical protein